MAWFKGLSLRARLVLALVAATILVGAGEAFLLNGPVIRCATVAWRGFDEVEPGVYVDRTADRASRQRLIDAYRSADQTIAAFFGGRLARPTVVLTADPERSRAFTGQPRGTAVTLRTPMRDFIVIRLSDNAPLLLAHEMAHAELDARLGWWKAQTKVPMWFLEGIAMIASDDRRFDEEALRKAAQATGFLPGLDELRTWRQFNRTAGRNIDLAYGTAYKEVSLWYRKAGPKGLAELIEGLKRGENFDLLYSYEESHKRGA